MQTNPCLNESVNLQKLPVRIRGGMVLRKCCQRGKHIQALIEFIPVMVSKILDIITSCRGSLFLFTFLLDHIVEEPAKWRKLPNFFQLIKKCHTQGLGFSQSLKLQYPFFLTKTTALLYKVILDPLCPLQFILAFRIGMSL